MAQLEDLATLLEKYIEERFDKKGSQLLARAVNDRFNEQPGVDFLSRNTIDNWCRGYAKTVREWEKLAAVAVVLGLSESEANQLLHAAGQILIGEKRLSAEKKIEKEILTYWNSSTAYAVNSGLADPASSNVDLNPHHQEQKVAQTSPLPTLPTSPLAKQGTRSNVVWQWLLLVLLLALFVLTGGLIWRNWDSSATQSIVSNSAEPHPKFFDDFSNPGQWNLNEAAFATLDRGRLLFDAPTNQTGDWRSDVVTPQWDVKTPISHLRFTAALDMSIEQTWGFLGIQTECASTEYADEKGNDDWLLVYIGGADRTLWIEYTPNELLVPVESFRFVPVVSGQSYQIDLIWQDEGVQIYLDDVPQGAPIACLRPMHFNFNAGLDNNMQIRGSIDDFALWE